MLTDGVWFLADEPSVDGAPVGNCGALTSLEFVPNVGPRAIHPDAVRIVDGKDYGICVNGGVVERIQFECASEQAVLQTRSVALQIIGSSLRNCDNYGLDVASDAQVTLSPGDLADYAQVPNRLFAHVHEQGDIDFTLMHSAIVGFSGTAVLFSASARRAARCLRWNGPELRRDFRQRMLPAIGGVTVTWIGALSAAQSVLLDPLRLKTLTQRSHE